MLNVKTHIFSVNVIKYVDEDALMYFILQPDSTSDQPRLVPKETPRSNPISSKGYLYFILFC